jgi:dTMP kinase
MRSLPGIFITFEGLDGCGKSTQLGKLAVWLQQNGHAPVCTREPGGTPMGDRIRELLLDSHTSQLSPWAELALMFASRAQHLEELILPALRQGKIVLCDRFVDSSEAYQGGGRQLGSAPVLELHRVLCQNFFPDLTILMDSEVAHSVMRARRRNQARAQAGADEARFERENRHFFDRVRSGFLAIAKREPQRVVCIDARRDIETVHREIVQAVSARLNKRATPVRQQRARG